MFLSALGTAFTVSIIVIVLAQYAFALFCLLKLAYFDVSRRDYALWNVFILLIFFIGGTVFLVYYYKHKDKHIQKSGVFTDTATDNTPSEAPETENPQGDDGAMPSDDGTNDQ